MYLWFKYVYLFIAKRATVSEKLDCFRADRWKKKKRKNNLEKKELGRN